MQEMYDSARGKDNKAIGDTENAHKEEVDEWKRVPADTVCEIANCLEKAEWRCWTTFCCFQLGCTRYFCIDHRSSWCYLNMINNCDHTDVCTDCQIKIQIIQWFLLILILTLVIGGFVYWKTLDPSGEI